MIYTVTSPQLTDNLKALGLSVDDIEHHMNEVDVTGETVVHIQARTTRHHSIIQEEVDIICPTSIKFKLADGERIPRDDHQTAKLILSGEYLSELLSPADRRHLNTYVDAIKEELRLEKESNDFYANEENWEHHYPIVSADILIKDDLSLWRESDMDIDLGGHGKGKGGKHARIRQQDRKEFDQ